jgi:hypothetical protein
MPYISETNANCGAYLPVILMPLTQKVFFKFSDEF